MSSNDTKKIPKPKNWQISQIDQNTNHIAQGDS